MKTFVFPIYIGELSGTPIGDLRLATSDQGLVAVEWVNAQPDFDSYLLQSDAGAVAPYANELREYLEGKRRKFTFPINWSIFRPFQKQVLQKVFKVPYGETRTYSEIALEIDRPLASRAVGRANATNPMPLVIPCHRLIGMDGKLHGYGGGEGLKTKEWLLKLEGAVIA
ncbi:MAG: methylated-DNA--[protein]-cysteine S-methyltransferase [Chloroflexi bacterium]|jgi:methylated-DNA-[protein]-cysteine S-methyltransferase|nr:MAG: methylated-DNA--[protein]-cysteine S-methyltransferase [Chloroflexota bacterium]